MGLSQWLREHGPKTGSGEALPKGVRARGKIKDAQIVHKPGKGKTPTVKPADVVKFKNGKVVKGK